MIFVVESCRLMCLYGYQRPRWTTSSSVCCSQILSAVVGLPFRLPSVALRCLSWQHWCLATSNEQRATRLIPVATAEGLLPEQRAFLQPSHEHAESMIPGITTTEGPATSVVEPGAVQHPKQPRPRDINTEVSHRSYIRTVLVTAKIDGAKGFLLKTHQELLLVTPMDWLIHTPWASRTLPTPFLLEGEFSGPGEGTPVCVQGTHRHLTNETMKVKCKYMNILGSVLIRY